MRCLYLLDSNAPPPQHACECIKSLTYNNILDSYKLKTFSDIKLNVTQKVEINFGKG